MLVCRPSQFDGSNMLPLLPRTRYSLGILLLACLASHSVMAANLPGDQDLIRDRQNRLLKEQQRRLEQLKELPGKEVKPEAPATPMDSRCYPIQNIELKGADSLPAPDRERLLKPYIGECLGVSQLNALLKVITDYYIDKGLVTSRAYLPQQDMSKGHLQVRVVEGKPGYLKEELPEAATGNALSMDFETFAVTKGVTPQTAS